MHTPVLRRHQPPCVLVPQGQAAPAALLYRRPSLPVPSLPQIGAWLAWPVRGLMWLTSIISWPLGKRSVHGRAAAGCRTPAAAC